jgi:uncharacterized protein YndB with AHSA1/START domain
MRGGSSYQRTEFIEVVEPSRLVCLMSNSDASWNVAPNPMMPDWPRTLQTTITFEETKGRTAMRLVWQPHQATEAEIAFFAGAIAGMGKGWAAGMDALEKILAELQS